MFTTCVSFKSFSYSKFIKIFSDETDLLIYLSDLDI